MEEVVQVLLLDDEGSWFGSFLFPAAFLYDRYNEALFCFGSVRACRHLAFPATVSFLGYVDLSKAMCIGLDEGYLGYVHIDFLDCRPPCSHERTGQLQQKASLLDACELLRHQSNILLSQWSGGCTNKYKELKQFPDMPYKRGHFYLITRFPPLFNTNVHTPTYAFSCSCFTG